MNANRWVTYLPNEIWFKLIRSLEAFIHTSLAYTDPSIPHGHLQERVYPMKLGDPEELLTEIVDLELKEIPKMTQRILAYYPNTYTFTKALTEHLIMKRVDINRVEEAQGGKKQWPVAIVRATQVGPAVFEPLPGWVRDERWRCLVLTNMHRWMV